MNCNPVGNGSGKNKIYSIKLTDMVSTKRVFRLVPPDWPPTNGIDNLDWMEL